MTDSSSLTPQVPRNRKTFFVVLTLFAAPLLLAFGVYYGSSWRPIGTTNKGDLITPAIPLPEVTLSKADGTSTNASFLREKWTLVYIGEGACAENCRDALARLANARLLLGKDTTRVTRAFLYTGSCCDPSFATEQADLVSANIDSATGQSVLAAFPSINGAPAVASQRMYIVDPLGNVMMSYPAKTDPRFIYQDLKKLLGLSHIG